MGYVLALYLAFVGGKIELVGYVHDPMDNPVVFESLAACETEKLARIPAVNAALLRSPIPNVTAFALECEKV